MNTLSIKIPEDVDAALTRVAANRHVSKSLLIREACGQYLASLPDNDSISLLERMDGIVGALAGPGDLSTNPAYMDGYGQ